MRPSLPSASAPVVPRSSRFAFSSAEQPIRTTAQGVFSRDRDTVPMRVGVGILVALTVILASCSSCSSGSSGPNASAPAAASPSSPPRASAGGSGTAKPGTDWLTYHGDAQRTGRSPTFPAPARLAVIAALKLDAAVYASPIVVNGITV